MTRTYAQHILLLFLPCLVFWISSFSNDKHEIANASTSTVFDSTTDSLALVALYNATNGNNWLVPWNLNQPISTWYGVIFNGRVDQLNLNSNGLTGSLPPELGNLSALRRLVLYSNQIGGTIPPELGNLSNLDELNLSENVLTGAIPPELGNLSTLNFLGLGANLLTGAIPSELGNLSRLNFMFLNINQLSGSLPPELSQLTTIVRMYLDNNQLTGSIPPELGNLSPNRIHLNDNNLSGCFQPELFSLCSAEKIDCSNNPNLPGGGDFDAFCANAIQHIPSSGNVSISSGTYQSDVDIISEGIVSTGSTVTFEAGRSILLESNFTVEADAVFTAEIKPCN